MNTIEEQLKPPAIGLIVTGALNGAFGLLALLSSILQMVSPNQGPKADGSEAFQAGYLVGRGLSLLAALLSVVAAPVIITGALKMMKGQNLSRVRLAAILAMIPMTSCCFLIGAPIGLWTLIVLNRPEVKAFFESGGDSALPPPPPTFS